MREFIMPPHLTGTMFTAGLPEGPQNFPGIGTVIAKNPHFIGIATNHEADDQGNMTPRIKSVALYMARKAECPIPLGILFNQILTEESCQLFGTQLLDLAAQMRAQSEADGIAMLDSLIKKAAS